MATLVEDARWNRQASPGASAVESRSGSFSNKDAGSLSIVFSASWVRLAAPIGEGAFSRVFEGVYTNPETLEESVVAVKILKKNMLKRRSDCLRFIKEAKIMTKISHRNIAACYGIGKYDDDDEHNPGSLFIVQELIKGGNLLHKVYKQMLNRQKCVYTSQEALAWMIDVAQGMQYLHSVTENKPMIIHRDLKLENIMLAPEFGGIMAKLVDFGLHKVIDDRIKKVVKRVVSEVNLGLSSRLARARAGAEEIDEEDELEAALAEQRAMTEASSVRPAGAVTASPLGVSPVANRRIAGAVARNPSRLHIESSGPSMTSHPEEDEEEDEEEAAIRQAQEATRRQQEANNAAAGAGMPARSPLSRAISGKESLSPLPDSVANPVVKVRNAPKKQSSMQKLMAKMKEIKLKVTGKTDTPQPGALGTGSSLSKTDSSAQGEKGEAAPQSKHAQNEALLDRILAEQSKAGAEKQAIMDDLGIMDGPSRLRKGPPRRAVTWVNEVRYNLTEAVGSWAYMAPEVVLGQPYNEKVDVFSFGVILFEVLNRKLMLVDEIKNDPRKDAQAYAERVARGFRPEIPKRWPSELVELIQAAWAQDPHVRPNFTAIVDVLKELEANNQVAKLDVQYWQKGSIFI